MLGWGSACAVCAVSFESGCVVQRGVIFTLPDVKMLPGLEWTISGKQ